MIHSATRWCSRLSHTPSTVLHSSLRTTAVARWSHISFCRKSSGGMIPDWPTTAMTQCWRNRCSRQAGFPDGFTTTLAYANVPRPYLPDPGGTASAVQADLEAVGIHAQLDLELWTDYLANIAAGNVDLFLLGWVSEYLHPVNFFKPVFCGSRANGFGPLDDLLCSEMGAALADPDLSSQYSRYRWAAGRVHCDAAGAAVGPYHHLAHGALGCQRLGGFTVGH